MNFVYLTFFGVYIYHKYNKGVELPIIIRNIKIVLLIGLPILFLDIYNLFKYNKENK